MSVDQFKNLTTPPKVRKALAPIDDELRQFQVYGFQPADGVDHLMRVVAAIQSWYAKKAHKIAGAKAGSNVLRRKLVVDELLEQCVRRAAWERYHLKKVIHQSGHRGLAPVNKPLAPGYAVERTLFTQMKAANNTGQNPINPVGGSFAHDVQHRAAGHGDPVLALIGAKNFDQLTAADFQQLQQSFSMYSMQTDFVHYIRKDERLKENYVVIHRGLLYLKGSLMHNVGSDQGWMYAMDEYGNLITVNFQNSPGANQQYNHSSLNAGKDVICAGHIIVNQGRIVYLDNGSGHYQPTPQHLHDCMQGLIEEDEVDFTGAVIKVMRPGPVVHKYANWQVFYNGINTPGQIVNQLGTQD